MSSTRRPCYTGRAAARDSRNRLALRARRASAAARSVPNREGSVGLGHAPASANHRQDIDHLPVARRQGWPLGCLGRVPGVRRPDRRQCQPWAICGPARGIYPGHPSSSVGQLSAGRTTVGRVAPARNEQPTAAQAKMSPARPPLAPPGPQSERARAGLVRLEGHDSHPAPLRIRDNHAFRPLRLPETSSADHHPSERGGRGRPSAFHHP
jgi:hypothetical protein